MSECSDRRGLGRRTGAAVLLAWLAGIGGSVAQERPFQFALMGSMPHSKVEEQEFANLIAMLNATDLAFAVHVGDMQVDARAHLRNPAVASAPCNDAYDAWFLGMIQRIRHPVVVTPGDNDWSDCHALPSVDPLARLGRLRATFFPDGRSLGQRSMAVESQAKDGRFAKFRENLRWSIGGVTFATLHTVGSDDNFGRTPDTTAEHHQRKAANLAWIKAAFESAKASNSRGVVLMTQANPGFESHWPAQKSTGDVRNLALARAPNPFPPTPYHDYIKTLADELESYDRPVAFLHGDTHVFRHDKPLYSTRTNRLFENFTRVETFGSPDVHWVKITVDPMDPQRFRVDPQIVPSNVANHKPK